MYPSGFRLAAGEHFVTCPYNMAHQITNAKLLVHLDRCRSQYRKQMAANNEDPDIIPCRYNFCHQLPRVEMNFHENHQCPERHSVISTIAFHTNELPKKLEEEAAAAAAAATACDSPEDKKEKKKKKKSKKSKVEQVAQPKVEEEDWDADARNDYTPGYDPKIKLENNYFLHYPMGMTKSEKKMLRAQHSERYKKEEEAKTEQIIHEEEDEDDDVVELTKEEYDSFDPSGKIKREIPPEVEPVPVALPQEEMEEEEEEEDEDERWERETGTRRPKRQFEYETYWDYDEFYY